MGLSVLINQHSITSWTSNNFAIRYSWLRKQSRTAQDWEAVAGLYREPRWLHVYLELPWLRAQTEKTWTVTSWGLGWAGVIRFTLPKARKSRSLWEEVEICWYWLQLQLLSSLLQQIQTQLKAGVVVPGCSSLMQLLSLPQLTAAAPCTVNTARSHSYWEVGGRGTWSSGDPRNDGDERALPLEGTSCPQPGTQALLSCWAYRWRPCKFLASSCWQLNCHGNVFRLPLQYSSKQSPLYPHSSPAFNCKGPCCLPVNPACEPKWSSVKHEQEELQAGSLIRTCKFHFRTPRLFFFPPPNISKVFLKTANTTAFSSQKLHGQWEQTHTSICRWIQTWKPWFLCPYMTPTKACFSLWRLKKSFLSYLIHYLHYINLLSCWEIMHGITIKVCRSLLKPLL